MQKTAIAADQQDATSRHYPGPVEIDRRMRQQQGERLLREDRGNCRCCRVEQRCNGAAGRRQQLVQIEPGLTYNPRVPRRHEIKRNRPSRLTVASHSKGASIAAIARWKERSAAASSPVTTTASVSSLRFGRAAENAGRASPGWASGSNASRCAIRPSRPSASPIPPIARRREMRRRRFCDQW